MTSELEHRLNAYLARRGSVHDCREAGCKLNPSGEDISAGAAPATRPNWAPIYRALFKRLRGYDPVSG